MKLIHQGNYSQAESYLRLACSLHPDDRSIRQTLFKLPFDAGKQAYESGNYSDAERQFQRFKVVMPADSQVHYYLANCMAKTGNLSDALAEYQNTLDLNPSRTIAAYASEAIQEINRGQIQNSTAPLPIVAHDVTNTPLGQADLNGVINPAALPLPALVKLAPLPNQVVFGKPLLQQATNNIQAQAKIEQMNSDVISVVGQQQSAIIQAAETARINENLAVQTTRGKYSNAVLNASLQAEATAKINSAALTAQWNAARYQALSTERRNLVNESANNLQGLLSDPASGLQAAGTNLYTRYYGTEPGKQVPVVHASVARIMANGGGQNYPPFTTDQDELTMRRAIPHHEVSGQVLP